VSRARESAETEASSRDWRSNVSPIAAMRVAACETAFISSVVLSRSALASRSTRTFASPLASRRLCAFAAKALPADSMSEVASLADSFASRA
jgi:hypothetical protein